MGHKSAAPGRLQRGKMMPRDRGEKYLAPRIEDGLEGLEPLLGPRLAAPRGEAHQLIKKLKPDEFRGRP